MVAGPGAGAGAEATYSFLRSVTVAAHVVLPHLSLASSLPLPPPPFSRVQEYATLFRQALSSSYRAKLESVRL
jgi:hypothetical protein